MSIHSSHLKAVIVVGSLFVLEGCGPGSVGDETGGEEATGLATTEQATMSGWTSYTSEEPSYTPIICDQTGLVNGAQCTGEHCDNVRFFCEATLFAVLGASYWSSDFSDENSDATYCKAGHWLTGFKCIGRFCDNVSIQCTAISNFTPKNCTWTGWYSENYGSIYFPSAYYARGMQCRGDYCDEMSYYICQK
ncbi:hypothetical protein [Stigmatella aurantiaca]|uniref:Uncharacterized protein n=1 Tax=Stigmatella aurantiaca (strain DW4/3-1) TaxID=378806 RepID=Q09DW3_STIAD|nr:hypothetical protein [Stigmatella aurantiaca]ADO75198.1 uncharacterized protein STAUR_7442 [Stigmatella aurantiaca DW4/3-1]EAU69891.1 hypothetical protein STIAU_5562 [Stigmatella aurantiaca DW4/3-1]